MSTGVQQTLLLKKTSSAKISDAELLVVGAYLLCTFETIGSGTGTISATYAVIAIGFVTSLGAAAGELLI